MEFVTWESLTEHMILSYNVFNKGGRTMKEINEAFDAMFKELQKTRDAYDYPSAAWSVIEECKKVVQSCLEEINQRSWRRRMLL